MHVRNHGFMWASLHIKGHRKRSFWILWSINKVVIYIRKQLILKWFSLRYLNLINIAVIIFSSCCSLVILAWESHAFCFGLRWASFFSFVTCIDELTQPVLSLMGLIGQYGILEVLLSFFLYFLCSQPNFPTKEHENKMLMYYRDDGLWLFMKPDSLVNLYSI